MSHTTSRWKTNLFPSAIKCMLNGHADVCPMVTYFTISLLPESGRPLGKQSLMSV